MKLSVEDVLVDVERLLVGEGVDTCDHFVDEDSQSPPVDGFAVALARQYLRGQVLWGAAEGEGTVFDYFSEAEIGQLEVTVMGDEDVLGF